MGVQFSPILLRGEIIIYDLQRAEWEASLAQSAAVQAQNRARDQAVMSEGNELFNKGDYNGAIAMYSRILGGRGYAATFENRGRANYMIGEYDKAIADFEAAYRSIGNFDHIANLVERARAYYAKSDYNNAIYMYTQAIRQCTEEGGYKRENSWFTMAYYNLALAYSDSGKEALAIESYKTAADYGNKDALDVLSKKGIQYTPGTPVIPVFKEDKPSARRLRSSAAPVEKMGFGLSIFLGILCGIGLMFSIAWFIGLITGKDQPLGGNGLVILLILAACVITSVIIIRMRKIAFILLLIVLTVVGGLAFIGIIPEHLPAANSAQTNAIEDSATVTSDALNLRAEASVNSDVVKILKKGDALTVKGGEENGWLPVEHEGDEGWVSSEFVGAP